MDFWNLGGGGGFYLSNFRSPQTNATCKFSQKKMGHPSLIFHQDVFQNPSCLLGFAVFFPRDFPYVLPSKFTEIFTELLGYCLVDASTTCTVPANHATV